MRSSYKKIGDYIQLIDERNKGLKVQNLLGLSISKQFIPSVANTIGTDMENYKIIRRNQFACSTMQVRRDKKMPVALLQEVDEAIISQAYPIFEVKDEQELLPEYLMMWFTRSEFDREACFNAVGGVRGSLEWEDFENMKLPIPHPDKQYEIVKEYNVIKNRITLNQELIQKLEETAQAIYREWFVDFEFPNENGLPYKSNGGEMVESEFGEIPKGWKMGNIGKVLKPKGYIRGPFGSALIKDDMISDGIPVYEQQHAIDNHRNFRYFINNEKFNTLKRFEVKQNDFVISCSGTLGKVTIIKEKDPIGIINQALLILRIDEKILNPVCFQYFITSKYGNNLLIEDAGGSAQVNMAKREQIVAIPLLIPSDLEQVVVSKHLLSCDNYILELSTENNQLNKLKDLLLSKLATIEN